MSDSKSYFCAGESEIIDSASVIGVGLIESAMRLTELFIAQRPKEAIFLGSCGSYGGLNIFDTVESNIAVNIELSYLSNDSFTPICERVEGICDVPRGTIINSSNYITSSKKASELFLQKKIDGENMEFFSFLSVAKRFGVKARGVFVVTNYCYENAHQEYVKNHKKAVEILTEYMKGFENG